MTNKTMGEIISTLRRERGMTQKELAEQLNVTDKAVSKWERDQSYPDTGTIPHLAKILGISIDELMSAKSVAPTQGHKGAGYLVDLILRAVPLAMGIAVIVTALFNTLDTRSAAIMLGVGLSCLGLYLLRKKD
ncbi:MAG: helix-turn-helix transcriptional regulator [Clostridia bacterium]|nr:helix-turn-helix transcriptional regulator [Clostridia bacterium]